MRDETKAGPGLLLQKQGWSIIAKGTPRIFPSFFLSIAQNFFIADLHDSCSSKTFFTPIIFFSKFCSIPRHLLSRFSVDP
jgi:hypothetical protein